MCGALVATFQTEYPLPQSIHNVFQGSFISHIEEMLIIWISGNVFDFFEKSLCVNSSAIVVAKDLERNSVERVRENFYS